MGNNTFARQERISGYRTTQSTEERRLTEQKTALQAAREAEKAAIAARVAAQGSGVPLKEWTDIKDRARRARTRRENLQRDINATQRKIRRLQSRIDTQEKVIRDRGPANIQELRAAPDIQQTRDVQRARRSRAFRQRGDPVARIQYGTARQSITVPVSPVQAVAIKERVRENQAIREREGVTPPGTVVVSPGVYELAQRRQREAVTSDAIIRERFGYGGYKPSEVLLSRAAPSQRIQGVITAATPTQQFYARGGGVPGAFVSGFTEQSQTLKDIRSGRISGFQSMAGTAGVATRGAADYLGGRLVGYVAGPAARGTKNVLGRVFGQRVGPLAARGLGIATTGGLTTIAALDYARQPTGTKKFDYLISAGGVGTGFTRGYAAGTRRTEVFLTQRAKALAGRQLQTGAATRSLGYPIRYRGVSVREMGVSPTISPATRPYLAQFPTGERAGRGPLQQTLVLRGTQQVRRVSPAEAMRLGEPGARLDEARSVFISSQRRAPYSIGTATRTVGSPWGDVTIARRTTQASLYSYPMSTQVRIPLSRRTPLLLSRRGTARTSQRYRPRPRPPRLPTIRREPAGRGVAPRELIRARPRILGRPTVRGFTGAGFGSALGTTLRTTQTLNNLFVGGLQGVRTASDEFLGIRTPTSTKIRQATATTPAQAQTPRQKQIVTFQWPGAGIPLTPTITRPTTPPPPRPPPPGTPIGLPKLPTIQESRGRRRRGRSKPRRSGSGSSLVTILGGRATQGGRSVTGFENRLKPFLYK